MGQSTTNEIIQAIILYSICSASLLVLNKLCMHYLPLPSFVAATQFAFSVAGVLILRQMNYVDFQTAEMSKIKSFSVYVSSFVVGLYANMRALQVSNVETVIVFRACTPLAVSMLDYLFLGRHFPSIRSIVALLLICCGAIGYVLTDAAFEMSGMEAYTWAFIYFISLCFQMTYGKLMTSTIKMSNWERTYYTNMLSFLPMLLFGLAVGETDNLEKVDLNDNFNGVMIFLFLSCVAGLCIGWAGWSCRSLVSAASYTLIGVTNKIITVIINLLIWDEHANGAGIACLFLCIFGGALYKQSPMRVGPKQIIDIDEEDEEIQPFTKSISSV